MERLNDWNNSDNLEMNQENDQNKTLNNFFQDNMNDLELDPFRLESNFKEDPTCTIKDAFSISTLKVELQEVQDEKDPALRFSYAIQAPLSSLSKEGEMNITYLNKGQIYEVILKCNTPHMYSGHCIESLITLGFQEKRFEAKETEMFDRWCGQYNNRILEAVSESCVNVKSVTNDPVNWNCVTVVWKPGCDCSVFLKINCLSGDFTKRKHSGEKGVPFLFKSDTYLQNTDIERKYICSSSCIVKIFQNKGAERKHRIESKQVSKLSEDEKCKLSTSSEITLLKSLKATSKETPSCSSSYDVHNNSGYCADSSKLSDNFSDEDNELNSPKKPCIGGTHNLGPQGPYITSQSSVWDTLRWLRSNRFGHHIRTFTNYSGQDLLRLSRCDLKDLIGTTDGIRLHNALQNKTTTFSKCLYILLEGSANPIYQAVYLEVVSYYELVNQICNLFSIDFNSIVGVQKSGPNGISICVTDEVVQHIDSETCFVCSLLPTPHPGKFVLSLR